MPQMAPLNWLTLYFFFMMTYIIIIIFNYYMFLYQNKKMKFTKINTYKNWKW